MIATIYLRFLGFKRETFPSPFCIKRRVTMIASGFLRWALTAVLSLFVVVGLSSCSKKDVKQDEAGFQTGGGEGGAGAGTVGAGEAGRTSEDLKAITFAYDS